MNQSDALLALFRSNGNRLTLGQILKTPLGYEWRARATELRHDGYTINLIKMDNKVRSNNLYELIEISGGLAEQTSATERHNRELGTLVKAQQPPVYFDDKKKSQQIFNFGMDLGA